MYACVEQGGGGLYFAPGQRGNVLVYMYKYSY